MRKLVAPSKANGVVGRSMGKAIFTAHYVIMQVKIVGLGEAVKGVHTSNDTANALVNI